MNEKKVGQDQSLGVDWQVSPKGEHRKAERIVHNKLSTLLMDNTIQLIFINISAEGGLFDGLLIDISEGGCRFVSNSSLIEGDIINLDIELGVWTINVEASVKRVVNCGESLEIGTEFIDLKDKDKNYISKILIPELMDPTNSKERKLSKDWEVTPKGQYRASERIVHGKLAKVLLEKDSQLIFLTASGGSGWFDGLLIDISEGGCRFIANSPFQKGETVFIAINMNEWGSTLNCTIRRMVKCGHSYEIGVEFNDLEQTDIQYISKTLIPQIYQNSK